MARKVVIPDYHNVLLDGVLGIYKSYTVDLLNFTLTKFREVRASKAFTFT